MGQFGQLVPGPVLSSALDYVDAQLGQMVSEIHKEGPVREQIMGKTVAAELEKDPDRKGYGVLVTVNRVRLAGKTLQERD